MLRVLDLGDRPQVPAADHRGDRPRPLGRATAAAQQRRVLAELVGRDVDQAGGDRDDLQRPYAGQHAQQLDADQPARAQHGVDAEHAALEAEVGDEEVRIVDAGDHLSRAHAAPERRADDVDRVAGGHRDQQVGAADLGAGQHLAVGRIADQRQRVDVLLRQRQRLRVRVDQDELGLVLQRVREVAPDLAGPDDHDPHAGRSASGSAGGRGRIAPALARTRRSTRDEKRSEINIGTSTALITSGPSSGCCSV